MPRIDRRTVECGVEASRRHRAAHYNTLAQRTGLVFVGLSTENVYTFLVV